MPRFLYLTLGILATETLSKRFLFQKASIAMSENGLFLGHLFAKGNKHGTFEASA